MFPSVFLLASLMVITDGAAFNKFHGGDCPKVEHMPNFNIDLFLGDWYVVENYNDNNVACLKEHFSKEETNRTEFTNAIKQEMKSTEKDEIEDEIEKEVVKSYQVTRSYLPSGGKHFNSDSGAIKFLSSESEMEISYPYTETGMLNLKNYQVVATDYFGYALVWRCQSTIFGHRRTAQIMSRKRSMSKATLEEIRGMIKLVDGDSGDSFNSIRHTDCVETSVEPIATEGKPTGRPDKVPNDNKFEVTKFIHISSDKNKVNKEKEKKKLLSIDVGGFHLSIHFPFF